MGAQRFYGTVHHGGTATLLARVLGWDATAIQHADVASIAYSISLIDERDEEDNAVVTGHSGVALAVADVVLDTPVDDGRWTVDDTGYNFRHTPDVSNFRAFTSIGSRYLVVYTLTMASGQSVIVQFELTCI